MFEQYSTSRLESAGNSAFTLAEVLITLGIIGIVAAMTIPTLMNKFQNDAYTTQLKKFYSTFSEGMKKYAVDNGCVTLDCTGLFDGSNSFAGANSTFAKEIKSAFKIIQTYNAYDSSATLYFKYLGPSRSSSNWQSSAPSYVTIDGAFFTIMDGSAGNCTGWNTTTTDSKLKNSCAEVFVDVNGLKKKPNIQGRDIFDFYLGRDGTLYPSYGVDFAKAATNQMSALDTTNAYWKGNSGGSSNDCGTVGTSTIQANSGGESCAARIMENGWKMDY